MDLYNEPIGQLEDGRYAKYVRLNARDVDLNNRWKMASVFEAFQEIAGEQCSGLGFGWKTLMEQYGYCFVIVRMHVEMDAYPGANEQVRVETWPENKLRLIFTRYFRIIDKNGRVIGRAASQWVLFDTKERTFVRPQNCPIVKTPDTSSLEPPTVIPKHTASIEGEFLPVQSYRKPVYSDFDYNGHVNNARYVEWVFDALPSACYSKIVTTLNIHYEHEISFETIIASCNGEPNLKIETTVSEEAFVITASWQDGTRCFTCEGTFA